MSVLSESHTEAEALKAHQRATGTQMNVQKVDGVWAAVPTKKKSFSSRIPGSKLFRGDDGQLATQTTSEAMAVQ